MSSQFDVLSKQIPKLNTGLTNLETRFENVDVEIAFLSGKVREKPKVQKIDVEAIREELLRDLEQDIQAETKRL